MPNGIDKANRSSEPIVGFIGLGRMGFPMAARLTSVVETVVVHNRTGAVADNFRQHYGARVVATPAEVAQQAEVIFTMADSAASSRTIYFGEHGLLSRARAGGIVVDMSTVSRDDAIDFASRFNASGVAFVDAPVSGSVDSAERGELSIMAGASEGDFKRVEPLLHHLANKVTLIGDVGSGAVTKLGVNLVVYALAVGVVEALSLARSAGIDAERFYSVLQMSAAGAPLVDYRHRVFLDPDSEPARFPLRLVQRDLELIVQAGQAAGQELRQASLDLELAVEAVNAGHGEEDLAALTKMVPRRP
jgi:3-hydroxyisobutyrate dehydrogenase